MPGTGRPQDRRTSRKSANAGASEPQAKYAATTWGSSADALEDLEVPSGQLCLVRRPGLEGLLKAGVLHSLDSLTSLVQSQHINGASDSQVDNELALIMSDPMKMDAMLRIIDRVVCYVVVKPEVQMTPGDITSRDTDVIYADMVDLTDKMFILNYAVGGTRDLERFRGELSGRMGHMATGESVRGKTE